MILGADPLVILPNVPMFWNVRMFKMTNYGGTLCPLRSSSSGSMLLSSEFPAF